MRRGRKLGEGAIVAIALALTLALALAIWWNRQPRAESVPPVHVADAEALGNAERIDVNSASEAELDDLPGIGPALAKAIITYRQEHGPFTAVDQLDDVPGIGPVKLEAMRPLVRLE